MQCFKKITLEDALEISFGPRKQIFCKPPSCYCMGSFPPSSFYIAITALSSMNETEKN